MGAMIAVGMVYKTVIDLDDPGLERLQEDKMGLAMGKMWRWVMSGTEMYYRDKEAILIPQPPRHIEQRT